ncbi:hypothetical protein ACFYPG_31585 [Micromonospora sp. NPDC005553]|uniref:hypothetical protein n=1 Tax=unclassified Micromonospora TaxID=2617518 RepID=UPI0033A428FB
MTAGVDRFLVVWTDATEMVAFAPEDADTVVSVLAQTAVELAEPRCTNGRPVSLTMLVATPA